MLVKTESGWHCSECGRDYTDEDDLNASDPCPSDDCPSNDEEFVFDDGMPDGDVTGCDEWGDFGDASDVFDIEYDH
jgi:hypothetical protein